MDNAAHAYLTSLLAEFGPTKPLPELIVDVNRIYHAFEAARYDDAHDEIADQLPVKWRQMFEEITIPNDVPLHVLDFGCGTGFASKQVLAKYGDRVTSLTCYDLSPEMLLQAKTQLANYANRVTFTNTLPEQARHYTLLVTNSVLHHLPSINDTLTRIEPMLHPAAWWLSGHEPSARFYRNRECLDTLNAYHASRRWRRFLEPARYWRRLQKLWSGDIQTQTARRAHAEGLFSHCPSALAINRIVDVGVAHNQAEAESGRGLDAHALAKQWAGRWHLKALHSYSFLGQFYEGNLPSAWQQRVQDLGRRFPEDGAEFMAVWQRASST